MDSSSPDSVQKPIRLRIKSYSGTVFKFYTLHSVYLQIYRIHMRLWGEGTVSPPTINLIRTYLQHVANRRVVHYLLHVHNRAIVMSASESLT